jgi:branched-chain amino acid transport system permease protein
MTELARDLYLLVAVLGLTLVVVHAGLPVLSASAFAAVGGVGALQLERAGMPIGSAVLLAVLAGAAAGGLAGALVARSDAAGVALATWALAWLAYTALLSFPGLAGGEQGLTRPSVDRVQALFGATITLTPRVHVVAAAVLAALAWWATARLRGGPAGADAAALRDDREQALALGVPAARRRIELMAVAGALCALAGAGVSVLLGVAAPADLSPLLSLQLVAAVIAGGGNPILGFAAIAAIPRLTDALAGAGASDAAATGVVTAALLVACIVLRRRPRARSDGAAAPAASPRPAAPQPAGELLLSARGLDVRLGAAHPLRGVDLELRAGEIHALIGPNGSGKTTLLRVLAGELRADGTVEGERVTRTLQRDAGFPSLTPYRQLRLALRAGERGAALAHFAGLADGTREAEHDRQARELLAAGCLPVARAAATGAPVLALDEPAAGLGAAERERLVAFLRRLAAAGRGVLIVEHDMRLVAGTADVVTVLDEGRVIAHGTPAQVASDAGVREVYLGAAA